MVSRVTGSHRTNDNVARRGGAHRRFIGGVALPVLGITRNPLEEWPVMKRYLDGGALVFASLLSAMKSDQPDSVLLLTVAAGPEEGPATGWGTRPNYALTTCRGCNGTFAYVLCFVRVTVINVSLAFTALPKSRISR